MASPVIKKSIRHYEGVIDGAETVTEEIACMFMRPMDLLIYDSTMGGATVSVEHSPDGGTTWFDWGSVSLTAEGYASFYPPTQGVLRIKQTSGDDHSIKWALRTSAQPR